MQNPEARRRTIVAALIAIGVVAVLVIAVWSRGGGDDDPPVPTAAAQVESNQTSVDGQSQATSAVELGSLIIGAYKCPETSTPDSDCKNAGAVDLATFSMTLPDGQVVSLDNADHMEDGSYQWLNIPIGSYTLPAANFSGPAGLQVRNISGPAEPTADGWTISNSDPNQPVVIDIMFAPAGGSPAAG
ncbi:MAG TPA: hypothetical protein VFP05_10010 [Thermomicrobiales bacterium]|nr:hypothetical protein [Thermomicrobiales bacterium]